MCGCMGREILVMETSFTRIIAGRSGKSRGVPTSHALRQAAGLLVKTSCVSLAAPACKILTLTIGDA